MFKSIWFTIAILWVLLGAMVFLRSSAQMQSNYTSVQIRRMPCGRILKREVRHENDAWRKTVTLMDPEGRVLATKTKTIEPEQCAQIQEGKFVPSLWRDCTVAL